MGILRFLNGWRERSDGTLEGPELRADAVEVNGSELYIQGTEPDADDGDIWVRNQ